MRSDRFRSRAAGGGDARECHILPPFNLTGPQAALGAPCYNGAELAVEKLNAAGGVLGQDIETVLGNIHFFNVTLFHELHHRSGIINVAKV